MQTDPFAVLPLDKWKWHPSPLAGQIAYCECELYREVALEGDEVLILGQIRHLAVHTDAIGLGPSKMHSRLAPRFLLELGATGTLTLED